MELPRFSFNEELLTELGKSLGVVELSIFGSALREDFRPESDIDLLIKLSELRTFSYFDLLEIRDKMEGFFGRPVDLIETQSLKNPFRREIILQSARKIYAA